MTAEEQALRIVIALQKERHAPLGYEEEFIAIIAPHLRSAEAAARAEERAACAAVAESFHAYDHSAAEIAAAIRARGSEEK